MGNELKNSGTDGKGKRTGDTKETHKIFILKPGKEEVLLGDLDLNEM